METFFVLTPESKLINHGANYKRKLGNHTEPILFPRPLPDVESKNENRYMREKMNIIKSNVACSQLISIHWGSFRGSKLKPVFRSSRIWIAWQMKLWARPTFVSRVSRGGEKRSKKQIYFKNKQNKQTNREIKHGSWACPGVEPGTLSHPKRESCH